MLEEQVVLPCSQQITSCHCLDLPRKVRFCSHSNDVPESSFFNFKDTLACRISSTMQLCAMSSKTIVNGQQLKKSQVSRAFGLAISLKNCRARFNVAWHNIKNDSLRPAKTSTDFKVLPIETFWWASRNCQDKQQWQSGKSWEMGYVIC